jgi:hypothetical protein
MKNLVLSAAVFGLASLATGCIFVTDNNNGGTGGKVTATWQPLEWDGNAKAEVNANCPAGGDTAAVYNLGVLAPTCSVDGDCSSDGSEVCVANKCTYRDLFNCSDKGGTTRRVASDDYTTWVEITSHDGAVLYAQSGSKTTHIFNGVDDSASFAFQVNRGYITAAWTLMNKNGSPTSCSAAGATGVEFTETGTGASLVPDQFNCTAMQGTTFPLPIDNYTFSAQALGGNPEAALGPGSVVPNVKVQYGNQLVNAGSVVLQVGF